MLLLFGISLKSRRNLRPMLLVSSSYGFLFASLHLVLCLVSAVPDNRQDNQNNKRKMTTEKKEMEVVKNLDLERYMGRWYEIASFPSIFQPKNGVDTRATYSLNPDGTVHVLNEVWNGGKRAFIEGSAYKTDPKSDEAKFKVKFYVPPFLPIIPVTGDYWVLYIDPEYQHAVIGQATRSYLWILSRTAHVEEETYKALVEKAVEEGYDVSKLHKTPQSDTPPESN
ncbi:temperature-induced lipocalin-1-like isoform X1 [Raphanus sativus]|uniref:Temperature-induced lipocalin-1-like isoform X1 n=1 Tax=Raphanus sativus TaxID=3726 RepID=A0A9W3D449_RAPSA|nr:temperature-induced lipocalin-1-like isoform X1 [Raphanus sativus]